MKAKRQILALAYRRRRPLELAALCGVLGAAVWLPLGCGETQLGSGGAASGGGEAGEAGSSVGETAGAAPGAGASGASSSPTTFIPCTSDKTCAAGGQLCDPQRFVCADCRAGSDCTENELCSGGSCVPFTACVSSRQCGPDAVCDTDAGFCVECVADRDCAVGQACAISQCRTQCQSDKTCLPLGQLCDRAGGYCVECLIDADCAKGAHCAVGSCEANVCRPSSTVCSGRTLLVCDTLGSGYAAKACADGCSAEPDAHCIDAGVAGAGGEPSGTAGENAGGRGGTPSAGGAPGMAGAPSVAGAAGSSGEAGAAGSAGAPGACQAYVEEFSVSDCGTNSSPSAHAYGGLLSVQLSGIVYNDANTPVDPFYSLSKQDLTQSIGSCAGCLRFNRASEGTCLCSYECSSTSHPLSDYLVDPYPAFNPEHTYSVQLDLGSAPDEVLNFAFADCGCGDNSGSFKIRMGCL